MRTGTLLLLALSMLTPLGFSGCGGADQPAASTAIAGQSWWTVVLGQVRAATGGTLEVVHDGTGWLLGKNEVTIDQVGEYEWSEGTRYATYRITVARADESFSAEIDRIECDELGIPTDQSQAKLSEAVDKIKAMLDRLQA